MTIKQYRITSADFKPNEHNDCILDPSDPVYEYINQQNQQQNKLLNTILNSVQLNENGKYKID